MDSYPSWIADRAFGGAGVAAAPNLFTAKDNWPDGPSAPGAMEAVSSLIEGGIKTNDGIVRLVFLVGGAGNGKSFMASRVVQETGAQNMDGQTTFARRSYRYEVSGSQRFRIINDATIPTEDQEQSTLCTEISSALSLSEHILVWVALTGRICVWVVSSSFSQQPVSNTKANSQTDSLIISPSRAARVPLFVSVKLV
ncbi:hypothetical protein RUE5091_04048 [Ruegeria denitrificans]|uniref:Uncharacterized protein n=1 Tax=Ruegeria denitrificans TaxID=1715692 RepID=A0A0P1IJL0_9RHOB|nr:hypothetical protein [Ruegeria denitrificans]CUK16849.1 hypothetical protein RUE5091_04048 [Ruegeria denitrificans]